MNELNSPIFKYVVVNGERLRAEEAQTSLFNAAFLASFGVYETVKIDRGRPFCLEEHLRRLLQSAQIIELELETDVATLACWFTQLLEVDPQATWTLRILALGADGGAPPLIAMQAMPLPTYSKTLYQEGASAVLYEGQRALPTCKSLNGLINYLARRAAVRAGALEGLLHHNGYLTEGSRSSLFAVHRGKLLTAVAAEVLAGVTRDIIVQIMRDSDHPVTEAPLPVALDLYDEIFISATSMHVMPITKVDDRLIGEGRVGPITKEVMARFEDQYKKIQHPE
ncbi:MAG: aminotransferase class IV [Acidobacteria bacterium]|nr:aminotransferase class IV [Acidobacteriota bacterium]